MNTFFAPAERATDEELASEINCVRANPFVDGLLHSVGGLLAVVNEHRQIVAVNDSFLKKMGIVDPAKALGLRAGEAVSCIHAGEEPGGCGTTKFCPTCGAAVAMVTSLGSNEPVERMCALTVDRDGRKLDLALKVRAQPVKVDGHRYLLLFLQDVSDEQRRAALERTFFHDINNMLNVITGAGSALNKERGDEMADIIQMASLRLAREVEVQRVLAAGNADSFRPSMESATAADILRELALFFSQHPASQEKSLNVESEGSDVDLITDTSVLMRVLCNMITNALEETEHNGSAKIWVEDQGKYLSFCVWNAGVIPEDVRLRIFQRNFSTKKGAGRGQGTYSMKLFGEDILGGRLSFTTSEKNGTVFRCKLPKDPDMA